MAKAPKDTPPPAAALTLQWDSDFIRKTDYLARLNHTSRNAFILRALRTLLTSLKSPAQKP